MAELKAAVKAALNEPTVSRKQRVTISMARKVVGAFLKTAKPGERDSFRDFLTETLKTLSSPAPAPATLTTSKADNAPKAKRGRSAAAIRRDSQIAAKAAVRTDRIVAAGLSVPAQQATPVNEDTPA